MSCNSERSSHSNEIDYKENSIINANFKFPDTVKLGEKNLAIITFSNPTFDTIVLPTKGDTKKFRYLLFSEFDKVNIFDNEYNTGNRVFKDSVLLYDREIYIGYEFGQIGIYEIGGLVKDYLIYDYSYIKPDSMQLYKGYSLITKTVVVTN
ncbi:hypothetical protein P3875_10540 [Myroides sp. JBRI-B21084]|uniref:hypothetical protein n=1 Tax=Myroides sp. JBRI-B21084 TaxID=3119977 RepID=UPI0026E16A0B|nr:hypothetical protein [Paenimyroides cloacae]WKW46210.1 hypothetical protein P3875_10540 [Paenimyroides cloacae]